MLVLVQWPGAALLVSLAIYLSLTLPRGATKVEGAIGRSDVNVLGGDVSFFGFLAILLLRCSPLAMFVSW